MLSNTAKIMVRTGNDFLTLVPPPEGRGVEIVWRGYSPKDRNSLD